MIHLDRLGGVRRAKHVRCVHAEYSYTSSLELSESKSYEEIKKRAPKERISRGVGHLLASQFGGEDSRGNFVKSKGGRLSELHVASLL